MRLKPTQPAPDTRRRLNAAAGEEFAEHGFHKASVRAITRRARVNVAAINYHFSDKAELYAAVLRECHAAAQEARAQPAAKLARTAEARLRAFVAGFLHRLLDPARPHWHGALMAREMTQPTAAFDMVVEQSIGPQARELFAVIAELTGGRLPRERVVAIGFSIVGQCLFHVQDRPLIDRLSAQFKTKPPTPERIVEDVTAFSLGGIRQVARRAAR